MIGMRLYTGHPAYFNLLHDTFQMSSSNNYLRENFVLDLTVVESVPVPAVS